MMLLSWFLLWAIYRFPVFGLDLWLAGLVVAVLFEGYKWREAKQKRV